MSERGERGGGGEGRQVSEALKRADRLRRGGSPEKALELLRALAQAHPGDARVHYEIGVTLSVWAKNPGEALPHLDQAIALGPSFRAAHLERALALARLERHADALAELDWLETAHYRNPLMLYTLRAESHQALGHHREAERDWTLALKYDVDNPWLLEQRAAARVALGQLEGARADLDAALEYQTRDEEKVDLELLEARASVRARLGDREGARGDLERALVEAQERGDRALAEHVEQALARLD